MLNDSVPSNKYTEETFISNLTENFNFKDCDINSVNLLIPKHLKIEIEKIHEQNEERLKKSKNFIRLSDDEINGDLDEVMVDINNFTFKEYFKELYFNGNAEVKQDWFFMILGRFIRITLFLIIYNRLHKLYLDTTTPKNMTDMVSVKYSFKDLFYQTESNLQTKFGNTISDMKNMKY